MVAFVCEEGRETSCCARKRTLWGAVVQPSCLVGNYSRFRGTVLGFDSYARFGHYLPGDIRRWSGESFQVLFWVSGRSVRWIPNLCWRWHGKGLHVWRTHAQQRAWQAWGKWWCHRLEWIFLASIGSPWQWGWRWIHWRRRVAQWSPWR